MTVKSDDENKNKINMKCNFCNKSSIYNMQCRCEKFFCRKHFNPSTHKCTYDFCKEANKILSDKLEKIDNKKV